MSTQRERREVYATRRWEKLRLRALNAAGWLCVQCAAVGLTKAAEIVHHKQPWQDATGARRRELAFDANNLEPLCRDCHGQAHTSSKPNPWDALVRQSMELENETESEAGVAPIRGAAKAK